MTNVQSKTNDSLQAARGLAAAVVVIHHCSYLYQTPVPFRLVMDILFNAHAAIVLFFVLSGYVLSASMLRRPVDTQSVVAFYVRRLFRIYPAVFVVSLLALILIWLLPDVTTQGMSEWGARRFDFDDIGLDDIAL